MGNTHTEEETLTLLLSLLSVADCNHLMNEKEQGNRAQSSSHTHSHLKDEIRRLLPLPLSSSSSTALSY